MIALCGGIILEEVLDLSFDRLLMMMMMMTVNSIIYEEYDHPRWNKKTHRKQSRSEEFSNVCDLYM